MEYLPYGETLVDEHLNSYNTPYKFNGKELDDETGNYYYGARYYNPKTSIWLSVDPLAETMPSWSSYNYAFSNPVMYTDPTGMAPEISPIYDENGNYLGSDSKGFTGQILIMSKSQFKSLGGEGMDHDLAMRNGTTFESANLSSESQLNIFNDIISYADGMETEYGMTFDKSSIKEGRITQGESKSNWATTVPKADGSFSIRRGTNDLPYEATVENITMSVVVHEWFSHAMMGTANKKTDTNHFQAYLSVMSHPMFKKTTDIYKGFNAYSLKTYYNNDIGGFNKLSTESILRSTYDKNSSFIDNFKKYSK